VSDGLGAPLKEPLFERVAIIGLGLIGSSLAHVCRRKGLARLIAASDLSPDVRARAKELGLADVIAERPPPLAQTSSFFACQSVR
jgi:cyclohexadieny/prephenate dehydrogenase